MTIRDVQFSFSDTSSSASFPIFGAAGTYTFPNSIDTAPLAGYLTELTTADQPLAPPGGYGTTVGNTYRDLGGGERLWLVLNCVVTLNTLTNVTFNFVTSASSTLSSPTTMLTSGAIAIGANGTVAGQRLIYALPRSTSWLEWLGLTAVTTGSTGTTGAYVAWIGWDVDAVDLGGASGFSIK
jgi:hypothetical protein